MPGLVSPVFPRFVQIFLVRTSARAPLLARVSWTPVLCPNVQLGDFVAQQQFPLLVSSSQSLLT